MTTLAEHNALRESQAENHKLLGAALDAADKVHLLLDEGVALLGWAVQPGFALGQVAKPDDATAIGWVSWISRKPGWRFEASDPRTGPFLDRPYIEIAAVTDVDGVTVKIWSHIDADVVQIASRNGAAA